MPTLHQILAAEKGVKGRSVRTFTDAHHAVAKTALLSGIARTYQPNDDDGERLPSESTPVQINARDAIADVTTALTELFDVVITKDAANQVATANVVVDDVVLLSGVPVTTLLFLEKQLDDIYTFVRKLPVLDPAESWTFDEQRGHYGTASVQTARSKKVMKTHVAYPATTEHPAQTQTYGEDVQVGLWTTTKFSGALPAARVAELTARVVTLQKAVTAARQAANTLEVSDRRMGDVVLGYLFAW
jgi:hypothetical protein